MHVATIAALLLGLVSGAAARSLARENTAARQSSSCENTATSRNCWGEYSIDTDYYQITPDTGVTREYWLTAEKMMLAPDGYEREVQVFNGSLPGPLIEADWGDEVVIHVTNAIPGNGTAIHWHGIRQLNTNAHDGVPGVTQCPISPGETVTYRWRAIQYGTTWYHSHFSLQLAEGLFGPIVIHGPASADYDVDVGPVMIQDWAHTSAFAVWEETQRKIALYQPIAENGLINGLNPYDCAGSADDAACVGVAERFEVTFAPGNKYLLRIVGVQADGWMKFTIDGHNLTVVASDLVPVEPYTTNNIILASGQRYDVVVEASEEIDNYWLRAVYQTACNNNDNDSRDKILGVVRYEGADTSLDPTSTVDPDMTDSCGDEPYESLIPRLALDVGDSDVEDYLSLGWFYELDLVFHWTIQTRTLVVNWSEPTILDVYDSVVNFPADSNVVSIDAADKWVYWIIQDLTLVNAYHPMHLHGHDFFVLAQGAGAFLPGITALNTKNPPRRDTATLTGNGYLVIAFKTDNPG
ncbi:laccase, multicopper oxidase, benzenediol:oxygen oxidorectuctase [Pestalotiopsis sp. 9143b]|nr:laccase, multicopper oxidase, benzenediol:oxygen oxidorectuctase [Pestalotiopsis sp. 9143b]